MIETIYVVPFFLDGEIDAMEAFRDLNAAQEAVRRYVHFDEIYRKTALEFPSEDEDAISRRAYGTIDRGRYAGTVVYELPLEIAT